VSCTKQAAECKLLAMPPAPSCFDYALMLPLWSYQPQELILELLDSQTSVILVTKNLWAVVSLPAIAQVQGSFCLFFCQLWANLL